MKRVASLSLHRTPGNPPEVLGLEESIATMSRFVKSSFSPTGKRMMALILLAEAVHQSSLDAYIDLLRTGSADQIAFATKVMERNREKEMQRIRREIALMENSPNPDAAEIIKRLQAYHDKVMQPLPGVVQ